MIAIPPAPTKRRRGRPRKDGSPPGSPRPQGPPAAAGPKPPLIPYKDRKRRHGPPEPAPHGKSVKEPSLARKLAILDPQPKGKLYRSDFPEIARTICERGGTNADIAAILGVESATIARWAREYPEFGRAIDVGGQEANKRVRMALYSRAVGHVFATERIMSIGRGQQEVVIVTETLPPDVTAGIFWLTNKLPAEFKKASELTVKRDNGPLRSLTDEQLEQLIAEELERQGRTIEGTVNAPDDTSDRDDARRDDGRAAPATEAPQIIPVVDGIPRFPPGPPSPAHNGRDREVPPRSD